MADIAFARKHRPTDLSEYMGDEIKLSVMSRFKSDGDKPQTILLSGSRGTGKTSLARLVCKEYLCMSPVDGHSCGHCEMCTTIVDSVIHGQAGTDAYFTGIQEIDVGVDSNKAAIDEILEDALIAPMASKYKILIFDECHLLTKASQGRMLKQLEEPMSHQIFILCTTDPEKLIPTIISRCQMKLEVKRPTVEELAAHLLKVCEKEKITTSMEALRVIGKKSERIPRDALNLLEEIAKENGNKVLIDNVRRKLGEVAAEVYMSYYKAANKSLADILLFNKELKEKDISAKVFMQGLIRFTLDCMYIRFGISIEDHPAEYVSQVRKFFSMYNHEEMDFLLQAIEYAAKMIDENDAKAELVITTTAMRIGKLKLLSVGLLNEQSQGNKETNIGFNKYREILEQDRKETQKAIDVGTTPSVLVSVFGKQVSEIQSGPSVELPMAEEDEGVGEMRMSTDDEILDFFSSAAK